MNIGSVIRKKREDLGLKVYELAKKVGISPVYITQIECYDKLPSPTIFEKILDILSFPPADYKHIAQNYVREKFGEQKGILFGKGLTYAGPETHLFEKAGFGKAVPRQLKIDFELSKEEGNLIANVADIVVEKGPGSIYPKELAQQLLRKYFPAQETTSTLNAFSKILLLMQEKQIRYYEDIILDFKKIIKILRQK